jgi:hypothetical protein
MATFTISDPNDPTRTVTVSNEGTLIRTIPTPTAPNQGNIVPVVESPSIPAFTSTSTVTPSVELPKVETDNRLPKVVTKKTDKKEYVPSTASSSIPEPNLPKIPELKFATPSPKIAKTKEEIQKIKTNIKKLEIETNLNRLPYLFGGELARIKHQFSDLNINKYYLLLLLLVGGFDNNILIASIGENHAERVIDDNFIKEFQEMINDPRFSDMLKKTPAYAKGCFDGVGQLGNIAANGDRMEQNPLTGPKRFGPSLVTNMLRKIHPDSVENIENFCNVIRSRAYLSMPKGAFGSLRKVVSILNGALNSFNRKMRQFYKGLNKLIKQAYAFINGIIADINRLLIQMIEEIIPVDFLCLLLDTAQVILDDIGFFVGLFNMSGPFLNYLNIAQTVINTSSGFLQNPFNTIVGFLPKEVQDVVSTIETIGEDPESFISDTLSNYGLSYITTALQGDIVGAMVQKFGKSYYYNSGPLADVMSKAKAFIGIDSLPMHVAQAFDVPGISFFGCVWPESRIYSDKMRGINAKNLSCLGCHHRKPAPSTVTKVCETGTLNCIKNVSVNDMWNSVQDLLEEIKNGSVSFLG